MSSPNPHPDPIRDPVPGLPSVATLEGAARWIRERTASLARARTGPDARPVLVAIAGPPGSGKSTLASRLSGCVVSTDRYLPTYADHPRERWDDPASADLDRLAADLSDLAAGRTATVPIWSFHEHTRTGEEPISPAPTVVVEGLFALTEPVAELAAIRVLMDVPQDERWRRLVKRESEAKRGWPVEELRVFFHELGDPTFARHAPTYQSRADLIVTG